MTDVILDALIDTLKLFPFLLLIYVLIEVIEHRTKLTQNAKVLQGGLAPLIGTATGIIPQCGFSVMSAKLYDKGFIRTGTLMAVFIATSDEALIILLSDMSKAGYIMPLIFIKLITAVAAGYLINCLFSKEKLAPLGGTESTEVCCNEHKDKSDLNVYFISPLVHTLEITLYLLAVNLAFGFLIYYVGEDKIASALVGGWLLQPVICGVIGLIPNCASSVILTGAFINGGILFGSFVGGLCANAGLGLVVLLKNTKKIKRNALFVAALYSIAVLTGVIVNGVISLF